MATYASLLEVADLLLDDDERLLDELGLLRRRLVAAALLLLLLTDSSLLLLASLLLRSAGDLGGCLGQLGLSVRLGQRACSCCARHFFSS